jgi:uncharacterized OB-fold protein
MEAREDPADSRNDRQQRVRLVGTSCRECHAVDCPPRVLCSQCGSRSCAQTQLSGSGTIVVATRVDRPTTGFPQPIYVGFVSLAEGPRIFARLESVPARLPARAHAVGIVGRNGEPSFGFVSDP